MLELCDTRIRAWCGLPTLRHGRLNTIELPLLRAAPEAQTAQQRDEGRRGVDDEQAWRQRKRHGVAAIVSIVGVVGTAVGSVGTTTESELDGCELPNEFVSVTVAETVSPSLAVVSVAVVVDGGRGPDVLTVVPSVHVTTRWLT
jgi:hypothetical protein